MFLDTTNEISKKQIKTCIPFTIAPKPRKYLGINLAKEVKVLHNENSKTQEETKKDTSGKMFCVRGSENYCC